MRLVPALLSVCLVSACGSDSSGDDGEDVDCAKVTGTDTYVVGLPKTGEAGMVDYALMQIDPYPLVRGNNTWTVQIADSDGNPLDGATLTVTPYMPAHDHISPIAVGVTPTATPGEYKLDPVNTWMNGVWETTIQAKKDSIVDSAVYTFCVP